MAEKTLNIFSSEGAKSPYEWLEDDQIGQHRPTAANTPQQILIVGANEKVMVKEIYVANVSNQSREYSIYVDHDGAVWDDDSVIFYEVSINNSTGLRIPCNIALTQEGATIAVESNQANNVNFMLFGNRSPKS